MIATAVREVVGVVKEESGRGATVTTMGEGEVRYSLWQAKILGNRKYDYRYLRSKWGTSWLLSPVR